MNEKKENDIEFKKEDEGGIKRKEIMLKKKRIGIKEEREEEIKEEPSCQPPRKRRTVKVLIKIILQYSR